MEYEDCEICFPTFDDFKIVLQRYPLVRELVYGGKRFLGLGYISGPVYSGVRLLEGEHARVNCAVTYWDKFGVDQGPFHFKKLAGEFGTQGHRDATTKTYIKLLKPDPGIAIRYWTNISSEGDIRELYRYSVVTTQGALKTFEDEEEMLTLREQIKVECFRLGLLRTQER